MGHGRAVGAVLSKAEPWNERCNPKPDELLGLNQLS